MGQKKSSLQKRPHCKSFEPLVIAALALTLRARCALAFSYTRDPVGDYSVLGLGSTLVTPLRTRSLAEPERGGRRRDPPRETEIGVTDIRVYGRKTIRAKCEDRRRDDRKRDQQKHRRLLQPGDSVGGILLSSSHGATALVDLLDVSG